MKKRQAQPSKPCRNDVYRPDGQGRPVPPRYAVDPRHCSPGRHVPRRPRLDQLDREPQW